MQISHRYSNSAAMINAAFNFNLDSAGKTIKEARVVYGLPGAPAHCLAGPAGEADICIGDIWLQHRTVVEISGCLLDFVGKRLILCPWEETSPSGFVRERQAS